MTIAALATAASVGSSVLGGVSDFTAGRYRAQIANRNAAIANANATAAQVRANVEQQDQDLTSSVLLGEQEAQQGASGLALNSRSFAQTRTASRALARRDALRIQQQGQLEARNFQSQAADYTAEAAMEKSGATSSLLGGFLKAGGSLITGAAKVKNAKKYSNPSFGSLVGARRGAGGIGHA